MEHPYRDYVKEKFSEYFGTGALSRNCERNVLNWAVQHTPGEPSWENFKFRRTYKMKAVWLMTEFKRNPAIIARIKSKELESTKLAFYPPDVLDPNGPYAKAAFKIKEKDNAREAAKAKMEEDYVGRSSAASASQTRRAITRCRHGQPTSL
jgi:hypothetical protein